MFTHKTALTALTVGALLLPLHSVPGATGPILPPEQERNQSRVFRAGEIDRPLRYHPDGAAFVITNGTEFFSRPLYVNNTSFRVDAGDRPEFSLYLPGRGGNLRFGIHTPAGTRWLHQARQVVTRYQPGRMRYILRDELLGGGELQLDVMSLAGTRGLIARVHRTGRGEPVEIFFAFGGANGMRGRRGGDIGCEREPVSEFFQLKPDQCRSNEFVLTGSAFTLHGRPATLAGLASPGTALSVADANQWDAPAALLKGADPKPEFPLLLGRKELAAGAEFYLAIQQSGSNAPAIQWRAEELPKLAAGAAAHRLAVAERVVVETPDPFINAAAAALNVAADGVWDEAQQSFMHGAVAWRTRLLGWRGPYAGDALGWHERTAAHIAGFARQQNTDPIPASLPEPEESANLSRNENALHSNGNLTKSHYDMNLVAMDALFRHLLWTGDRDFAERMWPTLERHLAWERRLFRREFGADALPLYEAYAAIWASDDLAYNGGGATHGSAYNYWHNLMAARVARWLGKDATPYEREAELIQRGMNRELWLADRGWFAEWKDLLGLQLVHPNAAAWTFYHTLDSAVSSPLEAWQMTRFVDTQIARIPLRGPGVPDGNFTMPTTSWMPYSWSLNNVVLAEVMHTSLAYWQAGRPEGAFPLFKGAVLDSMYLGLCPGNVGMATYFDTYRRESQRDFADGAGAMSRALVEGLFGVQPDAIAGELTLQPGFPAGWDYARLKHPDFEFRFQRGIGRDRYTLSQLFKTKQAVRLIVPAWQSDVIGVRVNGQAAKWNRVRDSVGRPRIEILAPASTDLEVLIEWRGDRPLVAKPLPRIAAGATLTVDCGADILELADPQNALKGEQFINSTLRGQVSGTPGHRTVFAKVRQGAMEWWQPVMFEIETTKPAAPPTDWALPPWGRLETVDLTGAFNDRVTQIFRNEYRTPRSPYCSLAVPKQGIGSWCHPADAFEVNDSGLRAVAARNGGRLLLPNSVPLATPTAPDARNILFVSQWTNYPTELSVPLAGRAVRAFLMLAGSAGPMQSRFDNGEIVATYTDGTTARLALHNPTTWWPIEQDYYIDDFAFARPEPLPVRVDLQTGRVRVLNLATFKGQGKAVPGGAATVLAMPLDGSKNLKSLTVRALANEVVIGLMAVTVER